MSDLSSFLKIIISLPPRVDLTPRASSSPVGLAAFAYEKIRNLIDYQEEHLLLRRAIARILIRRAKGSQPVKVLLDSLLNELSLARYLNPDNLTAAQKRQLIDCLERWLSLAAQLGGAKNYAQEAPREFILTLAARQIEEIIAPAPDDYLIRFALRHFESRVIWPDDSNPDLNRARLLVGLYRTLGHYDERTIYYKLYRDYFPNWDQLSPDQVASVASSFAGADQAISLLLAEEIGERLVLRLKKQIASLEIAKDLLNRHQEEIEQIFQSPESLKNAALQATQARYAKARLSLRRGAINSFVYVFITKMLLAIALEVPYERYLSTVSFNPVPLVLNLVFPPALVLLLTLTVEKPKPSNVEQLANEMVDLFFERRPLSAVNLTDNGERRPLWRAVFIAFYCLIYVFILGGAYLLLRRLGFSYLSMFIFYFFLSTVSFFAFRLRSSYKELVVGENNNLLSSLFDFLMLPFIRLGRLLSTTLQGLNVFVFIFDIILEAPFKLLLEAIQNWIRFLREKKDEALNVIK